MRRAFMEKCHKPPRRFGKPLIAEIKYENDVLLMDVTFVKLRVK